MTRGKLLRIAAAAALAAILLTTPAATAQGLLSRPAAGESSGLFASLWGFLTELLQTPDTLDNRCGIDPDGRVFCGDIGVQLDNRGCIDPDGSASCDPHL
jgi:hypothetical protein